MDDAAISFYDLDAVDSLIRESKIDPHHLRRARVAYFKKSQGSEAAIAQLPEPVRATLACRIDFGPLREPRFLESSKGEATKFISSTPAGYSIETVILRPATGRIALCISSQVGCAAACEFCATGHMGVARSLSAQEILHQVTLANERLGREERRVRNIVFMGMGEPLHNERAVSESLRVLQSPAAFDHPASRILVSTVGVPDELVRTAEAFPTTNFAISLHSAVQPTRERIVPLARKHSLDELRDTVRDLNAIQPEKNAVMIEHILLDGVNDADEDARALVDWIDGLRVHVNLIPYNPIDAAPHLRGSGRTVIERFGAIVRASGAPTTIRYSLGGDIDAACGQLVRDENRAVARAHAKRRQADSTVAGTTNGPAGDAFEGEAATM